MLYVAILKPRPGTLKARLARRSEYPAKIELPGSKAVAEFWLTTPEAQVIYAFETDNTAILWALPAVWDDLFEVTISPAVTPEEGLAITKQLQQMA